MIPRYSRPEMARIWELENKFAIWMEIEVLACEAQAELGECGITRAEAAQIRERAAFEVERIDELDVGLDHGRAAGRSSRRVRSSIDRPGRGGLAGCAEHSVSPAGCDR